MRHCDIPSWRSLAVTLALCIFLTPAADAQIFKRKKKKVEPPPPPPPPSAELVVSTGAGLPAYWSNWPNPVISAPKPDPVKVLMAQMSAAYDEGVQAYQSGHLVKARTEFDRAVDLVLQSDVDLHSNPALERQFDQLLDNIHRYEVAALHEGDGFTERKPVVASIDEVADTTFPVDPKLKEKVAREVKDTRSDFPLELNDHVLGYINYFSGRGKAGLLNGWRRAGRYKEMILRTFKEEGVPQDFIYLAQAESSFQPLALSRAGARGMWQFMAFTGKQYGLKKDWWVDLRQDPEKATRAAARHLHDLYEMFGDWYLAMAAYNSGPNNVQHAIERTGYADFWELYRRNMLPKETRNYVPIIVAVTIMAKNPEQYGLIEVPPDPPVETQKVLLTSPTDLRLIAETIDCSVELLQELNPSLLRWVTPKEEAFELRLPAGTAQRFSDQIAAIPENKRVWWRWHRVTEGESLTQIAKSHKTTAAAIREVNNLQADDPLQTGAKLVIPITPKNDSLMAAAMDGKIRTVNLRYRVRKGDTLAHVADRFGVTTKEVQEWNKIKTTTLQPGRVLLIHTVQSGPAKAATPTRTAARKKTPQKKSATTASARTPAKRTTSPASTLASAIH